MSGKGSNMTDETRVELNQIEGRLKLAMMEAIHESIKTGIKELKDEIKELLGKDIEHINEHLSRHDKYHEEHYKSKEKLWKAVDEMKMFITSEVDKKVSPIIEDVDKLKEKQIASSVSHDTADKIEDKMDRKKELSYGKVGALVAVASAASGGIVFLISYLL